MRFIADLHIHSRYSRAVSPLMTLEELDRWADDKGILVMGTGDFTHPAWLKDIKEKLEPAEPGLFKLKEQYKKKTIKDTFAKTRFMLSVEISCIYTRGGRGRRVHNLVFAPTIEAAEKIHTQLSWIGNVGSDGRPILGLDSEELLKIVMGADPACALIPAHAWTPWFAVFGSMSGFDSLEECFGDNAKHIFAIETGLSSDPPMNWQLSKLDEISLISNSDSHSLERIGREANIFDTELSYGGIMEAIRSRREGEFVATIEFFPEEGKYHYDGHRACGVRWSPEETAAHDKRCTKCGKPVTVGVLNRLAVLADRKQQKPELFAFGEARAKRIPGRVPYMSLVPLDEAIAAAYDVGTKTKTVREEYARLIRAHHSELRILLEVPETELRGAAEERVCEAIRRIRRGELTINPGFDGEFGTVTIFGAEAAAAPPQEHLF
jgi:uncharacterized protein (TIGR00375 family)